MLTLFTLLYVCIAVNLEIYFVRHGQSRFNVYSHPDGSGENSATQWDATLTRKGVKDALDLRKVLAGLEGDITEYTLVSSPLRRAFATLVFGVSNMKGFNGLTDPMMVHVVPEVKEHCTKAALFHPPDCSLKHMGTLTINAMLEGEIKNQKKMLMNYVADPKYPNNWNKARYAQGALKIAKMWEESFNAWDSPTTFDTKFSINMNWMRPTGGKSWTKRLVDRGPTMWYKYVKKLYKHLATLGKTKVIIAAHGGVMKKGFAEHFKWPGMTDGKSLANGAVVRFTVDSETGELVNEAPPAFITTDRCLEKCTLNEALKENNPGKNPTCSAPKETDDKKCKYMIKSTELPPWPTASVEVKSSLAESFNFKGFVFFGILLAVTVYGGIHLARGKLFSKEDKYEVLLELNENEL